MADTPEEQGAPPQPQERTEGKEPSGQQMTRRGFLSWLNVAWIAFSGAVAAATVATGRFMFPNVLFEPPMTFKVGYLEEYAFGVDIRWKEKYGVWIVRDQEKIYALRTVCTHLGCPPNWLDAEQKFKCPCHGSGFYMSGINFEGPAPRPLERYRIVIAEDGQIMVDKTTIYQYEKGQWSDSESFIKA
ncbi:MAG: ubiquinol-cytochrome c reductase iron-sulfur subunit [Candidatus Latescibacteria bacterium]|nr:ubiquinol-cytochrome c reductase iron-sulfur subunit [Candidatus Latescibacterota bacterium]